MPNVIDLFAGAGGLSLGASRAGFNVISAVDFDKNALQSHITNFPNSIHINKDINELSGKALLKLSRIKNEQLIGVFGGPPCQGFSNMGHGNVDDNRNKLFTEFFRLIQELQPLFFLAENVPGIMNSKYNNIRANAMSYVSDYIVLPPFTIKASEYGAPTTRTRVFFFGYKDNERIAPITLNDFEAAKVPINDRTNVRQALEGLPSCIKYRKNSSGVRKLSIEYCTPNNNQIQSDYYYQRVTGNRPQEVGDNDYIRSYTRTKRINGLYPTKHSATVRRRYSMLTYGQQDVVSKSTRLNPDGFCPTLRAGTGPDKGSYQAVRPIHYESSRVITPREAARLQGFPDWYKLPDTIWHGFRQIGNSVSPIVAEQILRVIYQKLT